MTWTHAEYTFLYLTAFQFKWKSNIIFHMKGDTLPVPDDRISPFSCPFDAFEHLKFQFSYKLIMFLLFQHFNYHFMLF